VGHTSALAYGPTVTRLLAEAGLNELGPGAAQESARAALEELSPVSLVAPRAPHDHDMALACCAALWLRFDFLDKSHRISQSLDTPEGSFWHGVMHRRETDFSNARYWFRRVGKHEIYPPLAEEARQLCAKGITDPAHRDSKHGRTSSLAGQGMIGNEIRFLQQQEIWDPLRFVDLCEAALDASPPLHKICMQLQQLEWQVMFDHCYQAAST
jgi:hypothetical protein